MSYHRSHHTKNPDSTHTRVESRFTNTIRTARSVSREYLLLFFYGNSPGLETCDLTAFASFTVKLFPLLIIECDQGNYHDTRNIEHLCKQCPALQVTRSTGSDSQRDCICETGYWDAKIKSKTPSLNGRCTSKIYAITK